MDTARLDLKICLSNSMRLLNGYKKLTKSKYNNIEKQKLKYRGFSINEINEICHPELLTTNRY